MMSFGKQRGVGLIEVMIALLVLAIGLLGFAGLQTRGITLGRKAFLQSQAIFLAQDMIERIRANCSVSATGACDPSDYAYSFASTTSLSAPTTSCDTSNCTTSAQMTKYDQYKWGTLVQTLLPKAGADIVVTPLGASGTQISIDIQYLLDNDSANSAFAHYVLRTQL